jgi:hypothetical protein
MASTKTTTKMNKEPKWTPKTFNGQATEWINWRTSIDDWLEHWGYGTHLSGKEMTTRGKDQIVQLVDARVKALIKQSLGGMAETHLNMWTAEQRAANKTTTATDILAELEKTYFKHNQPACKAIRKRLNQQDWSGCVTGESMLEATTNFMKDLSTLKAMGSAPDDCTVIGWIEAALPRGTSWLGYLSEIQRRPRDKVEDFLREIVNTATALEASTQKEVPKRTEKPKVEMAMALYEALSRFNGYPTPDRPGRGVQNRHFGADKKSVRMRGGRAFDPNKDCTICKQPRTSTHEEKSCPYRNKNEKGANAFIANNREENKEHVNAFMKEMEDLLNEAGDMSFVTVDPTSVKHHLGQLTSEQGGHAELVKETLWLVDPGSNVSTCRHKDWFLSLDESISGSAQTLGGQASYCCSTKFTSWMWQLEDLPLMCWSMSWHTISTTSTST